MAYTENPRPIIRCQFWVSTEPPICTHWDTTATTCTYQEVKVVDGVTYTSNADLYPTCNYLGTANAQCSQYNQAVAAEGEDPLPLYDPRCVAPDPYRHIAKTPNCTKWVVPVTVSGIMQPLDFSAITEYNEGKCNLSEGDDTTGGTASKCSAHTPQHLGFSGKPIPEDCTISGTPAILTGVGETQLPMNYDVLNKRAQLGKCMWWNSYKTSFDYVAPTNSGTASIQAPDFSCTNSDVKAQEFATFFEVVDDKYVRPPCNGAAPDCPKYTGNLANTGYLPFISNVFMRHGDKIMAEQILELRYNIKKEQWNPEQYKLLFGEEEIIYAHEGTPPDLVLDDQGNITDYNIQAVKVSIAKFLCLAIERKPILLTKGSPSDDGKVDFATLIKEIGALPLAPIIHSAFDTPWNINDNTLSFEQKTEFVFETPYTDHSELLIVGEHFSRSGAQNDIFAINVSDEDISFPFPDMFHYYDMESYRHSMSEDLFSKVHSHLECYFTVLKDIAPEKLYYNTFSNDNRAFMMGVPTSFGGNHIVVFDTSGSVYSWASITVTKLYCGGVVAQTGFEVTSPDKEVSENVDFEFLNGHPLFKPTLSYKFEALHSSDGGRTLPYHTYLDTKMITLKAPMDFSEGSHYILGYRMYKVKILSNFFVDMCDSTTYSRIVLLGNDGHMLVVIDDDYKLHYVIRKWDTGVVDENGNSKPMELFLKGTDSVGEEQSIEMTIVEYCSDRLEANQLILKPKNASEYVRLYGCHIEFGDIYVYERYSFGQTPTGEYEEIKDGWSDIDTVTHWESALTGGISSNKFTVADPPIAPVIATIMYKGGVTLRVKGQAKTDLMNWVKQPFCSDVEINYSWTATYRTYTLLPTHYCFVHNIGVSYTDPNTTGTGPTYPLSGYSPMCGDHNFGRVSQRPSSMWYPYTSCDSYASYSIYQGSGENDSAPMEFWLDAQGKFTRDTEHGAEDLRMLGPAINYGVTTDVHTSVWACGCDWTHMNWEMTGTPFFSGSARIRSGVEGEAYVYMVQNGGTPPKFGNKKRPYLMSFRSTAYLSYYSIGMDGGVTVEHKWMPPYEGFSDLRLDKSYADYPWRHYFNTSDYNSTYMSQFGLLAAKSIDGVSISEYLVSGEGENSGLARYRFTDIFKAHHTTVGTRYPEPRKQYYVGQDQKPVTAWLTYKDFPDNPDLAIQWAWREFWQTLERGKPDIRNTLMNLPLETCDQVSYNMDYLSFLGFNYPNYTYDYRISEFRRVVAEGGHTINWLPSTYDPENPLPTHFLVWLDDGPKRLLNPECELITEASEIETALDFGDIAIEDIILHTTFYKECSGTDWLNNITSDLDLEGFAEQLKDLTAITGTSNFMLYSSNTVPVETEEEAIQNAVDDEREIVTTDSAGDLVSHYFNRGIVLDIKYNMLQYIPREEVLLEIDYEFNLSAPADDDSQYSTIIPLEYYPATPDFGMVYNSRVGSEVTLTFKFPQPLLIGRVEVVYFKGETVEDEAIDLKTYYNVPYTVIAKSTDGQSYDNISSGGYEFAEPETPPASYTKVYDINDSDLDYMKNLYSFFSMTFTYGPSAEDLEDNGLEEVLTHTHMMDIRVIRLYTVEYTPLTEVISTYERLYNVSVGSFGDIPVHGHDDIGSLLYPNPWELSTIYQQDNSTGMIGAPGFTGNFNTVSKIRGRKCKDMREDGEVLAGDYSYFEGIQKELWDEIALDGEDTVTMTSIAKEVLKPTMANTKVNVYPQWACTLTNKNMVPLKPVPQKSKYYPQGHRWVWGLDNVRDFFNCGGGGKRTWVTIFDYKWCRVSGIYGCTYDTDAVFDLYTFAVSKALTHWANNSGLDDIYARARETEAEEIEYV